MNGFKTLGGFAQDRWRERSRLVRERYQLAVRPIYTALPNGRPKQFGSGVLAEIDGERCLVTAAHVLDEQTGHFLGAPPILLPLNLKFDATVRVEEKRTSDHVDVAVARLDAASVEATRNLPFVQMADQLSEPPTGQRMFLVMGYRSSRNRAPLPGQESMTPEIWSYRDVATSVPDASSRLGGGSENFGIAYPKYGFRLNGEKVPNADPAGASGGAIFDLGSVAELDLLGLGTSFRPRLAGIFIECRKRTLIGTHIDTIHGILRRAADEVRAPPITDIRTGEDQPVSDAEAQPSDTSDGS